MKDRVYEFKKKEESRAKESGLTRAKQKTNKRTVSHFFRVGGNHHDDVIGSVAFDEWIQRSIDVTALSYNGNPTTKFHKMTQTQYCKTFAPSIAIYFNKN
jgi:hypothetical protein